MQNEFEQELRQVRGLVRSSVRKMNHLWEGATGSDHKWLCGAHEDASKAWQLLEKMVERLEVCPEPWVVNLYENEENLE